MSKWGISLGGSIALVRDRLSAGWDLEDALTVRAGEGASMIRVEEDSPDLLDDVLSGDGSAKVLAARHNLSERTIVRIRARLRKAGRNVRVPEFGDHPGRSW